MKPGSHDIKSFDVSGPQADSLQPLVRIYAFQVLAQPARMLASQKLVRLTQLTRFPMMSFSDAKHSHNPVQSHG